MRCQRWYHSSKSGSSHKCLSNLFLLRGNGIHGQPNVRRMGNTLKTLTRRRHLRKLLHERCSEHRECWYHIRNTLTTL